ncbi:hypothetical protein HMF8227_00698 [Saliniradius amylolyticus]|uniref:PAS domain-containing protein n=1 Tax=Saliniradius amylolyticus TaxID=2183582 RepID=A0A2S2E0M3_9ALTE|nr:hypothetical protein [Saliniradius amylolyticus]AWL11194.1 hypothetical protein HMF8227_00698 [Saliniradius amylolyticus]
MDFADYQRFVDSLPIPALLVKVDKDDTHLVHHLNPLFTQEFGYTQEDIPDKQRWWEKAYPDPDYREAVERQWELEYQLAADSEQDKVSVDARITDIKGDERRYRVATNISTPIIDGIYPVFFINLEPRIGNYL